VTLTSKISFDNQKVALSAAAFLFAVVLFTLVLISSYTGAVPGSG
jgi:hypothetical protein